MRLSYSLLRNFQMCEFRTKLFYVDRIPEPFDYRSLNTSVLGRLAHAGQEAALVGEAVRPAVVGYSERNKWDQDDFLVDVLPAYIDRAVAMTERWKAFFKPERFKTYRVGWHDVKHGIDQRWPAIDQKFVIDLPEPIGIFRELVIKPDYIGVEKKTDYRWLYDWKWQTDGLGDVEDLRWDLQGVIYQYGLALLEQPLRGVARVVGLLDEPTRPKINKDGSVSRARIRCSWEDYEAVLKAQGQEVADYADMREKLADVRFFEEYKHYRSMAEVEAMWEGVIKPLALRVSRAVEEGFGRRIDKVICGRCPVREECVQGLFGRADRPAFNTARPLDTPGS